MKGVLLEIPFHLFVSGASTFSYSSTSLWDHHCTFPENLNTDVLSSLLQFKQTDLSSFFSNFSFAGKDLGPNLFTHHMLEESRIVHNVYRCNSCFEVVHSDVHQRELHCVFCFVFRKQMTRCWERNCEDVYESCRTMVSLCCRCDRRGQGGWGVHQGSALSPLFVCYGDRWVVIYCQTWISVNYDDWGWCDLWRGRR